MLTHSKFIRCELQETILVEGVEGMEGVDGMVGATTVGRMAAAGSREGHAAGRHREDREGAAGRHREGRVHVCTGVCTLG